jgi:hypothetical protein
VILIEGPDYFLALHIKIFIVIFAKISRLPKGNVPWLITNTWFGCVSSIVPGVYDVWGG